MYINAKVISWSFWDIRRVQFLGMMVFGLVPQGACGDLSNKIPATEFLLVVQVGEHTIAEKLGEAGYKPGSS